ncbi:MAG: hypothetical protein Roseis2KO_46760 [Roseivirga sp.]
MTQKNIDILKKKGWIELESCSDETKLLEAAKSIGNIVKQPNQQDIFSLYPSEANDAKEGTFSNLHGKSEFPLHTDTAFLNIPIRYMLLNTEKDSFCGTTVLSTKNLFHQLSVEEMKIATKSIFLLKTNKGSYFTSLFFRQMSEEGFRYDSTCMTPINKHAKDFVPILQRAINGVEPEVIKWDRHKTVLIDNWKTLHGRESIGADSKRELKRIYINVL